MSEPVKKQRSRGEWERLMARFDASGLTQRAFCMEQGVAYSSFCYWRKQLRSPAAVESQAPLIELSTLPAIERPTWRVELDLGQGIILRLR